MSYVGEVLKSARYAEMTNLNSKINSLIKTSNSFKQEVITMLNQIYVQFDIMAIEDGPRLSIQKRQVLDDIQDVESRINAQMEQNVKKSQEDLKRLNVLLLECKIEMGLVDKLININEMLDKAFKMSAEVQWNNIVIFAQHLKQVDDMLHPTESSNDLRQLDIWSNLQSELIELKEKLINKALEEYKKDIVLLETFQDESNNTPKKHVIKISKLEKRKDYIQALYLLDPNLIIHEIHFFSKQLYDLILKPMCTVGTKIYIANIIDHMNIQVEFKTNEKINLAEIVDNVLSIFNTLNSFLHFNLDPTQDPNVDDMAPQESFSEDNIMIKSFYTEMGAMIGKEFIDHFIQNCLNESLPTNESGVVEFEKLLPQIDAFDSLLKSTGFLSMEESPFKAYRKENIGNLITNKKCITYLEQARTIMKKSLHNMEEISPTDISELLNSTLNRKIAGAIQDDAIDNSLCSNLFQFPKCFISKSTLELMDLTHKLLNDLCTEQDTVSNKLCHTMLNIFIMYCDVVPYYHQKLLETSLLESALLHNNCMYIAHKLCTLGDDYREQMSKTQSETNVKYDMVFVDSVVMLRDLSKETLNKQLEKQKNNIKNKLAESGLKNISTQLSLPQTVEQNISGCIEELFLLQTVWQDILPKSVYCKSVGTLVHTMIKEIIKYVVNTEDISYNVAQSLLLIFDMIKNRVTSLLPGEAKNKILKFVKNWNKFLEMIKVFNSKSPRDIEESWNNGKGPLANEFTPAELKSLIRALIQNSQRRNELLDKII